MKNCILLTLVSLTLPALAPAQTTTVTTVPRKPAVAETDDTSKMPDGVLKMNGVVYIVKGGVPFRVDTERVMRVSPDGTVTNFDGSSWAVQDGQMMGLDGSTVKVPGKLLDTRAVEQAMRPSSDNARNYSGLAPAPAVPSPQLKDANATGNTNARGGQVQSTGQSGTNRARGSATGIDAVVPLSNDAVLTEPAQVQGTTPATGQNQNANTTTGTASRSPNATNPSTPGAQAPTATMRTTNPSGQPASGTQSGTRASGTSTSGAATSGGSGAGTTGGTKR